MSEVLAIKIGTSRISLAEFEDNNLLGLRHHPLKDQEIATQEILAQLKQDPQYMVTVCSVVPSVSKPLIEKLRSNGARCLDMSVTNQHIVHGTYETLGQDRIANVIAGLKLYGKKDPVIVLDFGSSTTLTAVDKNGQFLGGMISLGLGKIFEALHNDFELLPEVDPEVTGTLNPLANNTEDAIINGCYLSHVGLIDNWVKAVHDKLKSKTVLIATGGFCRMIAPFTKLFDHVDPELTLKGISFVAEAAEGEWIHSEIFL